MDHKGLSYKCDNCGGEMRVGISGGLLCPYCGSKIEFKDKDLAEYKNFRSKLLLYLKSVAESSEDAHVKAEELWSMAETESFEAEGGTDIKIKYLYKREYEEASMYIARNSVVYIFGEGKEAYAKLMLDNIGLLRYPEADLKDLPKNFPQLTASYDIGGRKMLVFGKSEEQYPLAMFGNLNARDAAWIVSRMENICAVLRFSELYSGGIGIDSVLINPRTHEAMLMGPWWNAGKMIRVSDGADDLKAVRKTAGMIMGDRINEAPAAFVKFIESAPQGEAYDDFAYWDEVIDKGFGGRSFAKFDIDNNLK